VSGAVKSHNGRVSAHNLQPHGLEILIELPVATAGSGALRSPVTS
jgi:K+-sensing histidine kinase KdpD